MPINYFATNGATFSTTSTTSTWSSWCTGDAGTTSSTGTVWNTWVSTAATSATTTEWPSTAANVWKHWAYADAYVSNSRYSITEIKETEQERKERIKDEKRIAYNALCRKRRKDAKEKQKEEKARQLLKEVLTEEQDQQLDKDGYFELVSVKSGQRYRINNGRSRNVEKIDENGKVIKTLCFHPREYVHNYDTLVIQKLMLENDEEQVLKIANFS